MIIKQCTKCDTKFYAIKVENFAKHFQKRKNSLDGFSNHCKKCTNEYKRKWQQDNGYKKKKKPLLKKDCVVCLKPFETRRESTTTCSTKCSNHRKKVYMRLERRNSNYNEKVKKKRQKEIQNSQRVRKHYSDFELDIIKKFMNTLPVTKIAKKINRTYFGTYYKVKELKELHSSKWGDDKIKNMR